MSAAKLTPLLLRPDEAADLLGIGRSKLFELLARRDIESIKVGACRRIPREALEAYVLRERGEQ